MRHDQVDQRHRPSNTAGRLLISVGGSLTGLTLVSALLAASAPSPELAQQSQAMRSACRYVEPNTPEGRRRAEQWVRDKIQAFVPSAEEALRMVRLQEEVQQVQLAFFNIASTCEQYRAGKMSSVEADDALHGSERVIAAFLHELDNELTIMASLAQVASLDRLRTALTETGAVGRQAALMGEEELAETSRKQMVEALVRFSGAFVERTCWDQVFDDALPFSLARQNDLLGTGIDVMPCAQRRFRAVVPPLTFESCTVRGVGEWRVRWDLVAPGVTGGSGSAQLEAKDDAAEGDYKVDWGANGAEYRASGDLKLTRRDNGPGEKATYTLAGEMDIRLTRADEMTKMMLKLMNQKVGGTQRFRVEPQVSDKPCRSL